jgi:hypothetical protein
MKKRKQLLPFIKNEDLYSNVQRVITVAKKAASDSEAKIYSNVVDPFSALFDASCQGISLDNWIGQEKSRQIQKTLQNSLGTFHQEIIGSIRGWQSLGNGKVFDVINKDKKIIAEIKNKYNTTKGNHKVMIYDDLRSLLKSKYPGYIAYYVEIIPPNRKRYNKPFTPSDNKKKKRRPKDKSIRIIDGMSFYEIASGDPNGLRKLYDKLPIVISDLLRKAQDAFKNSSAFKDLFDRAY